MEAADTAKVGGLSILDGLLEDGNILGALGAIYPTQENTAVHSPLANLTMDTCNSWVEYVGGTAATAMNWPNSDKGTTRKSCMPYYPITSMASTGWLGAVRKMHCCKNPAAM